MGEVVNMRRFIVIEGADGSGKSTLVQRLLKNIRYEERSFSTAQPSQLSTGALLRQELQKKKINPPLISLLFAADRLAHLEFCRHYLETGAIIFCDRYVDSNFAYRDESLEVEWLEQIERFAPRPGLTLYLDVKPEVAMARIHARGGKLDTYENEETITKVIANYQKRFEPRPEGVAWINANLSPEEVEIQACQVIDHHLKTSGELR